MSVFPLAEPLLVSGSGYVSHDGETLRPFHASDDKKRRSMSAAASLCLSMLRWIKSAYFFSLSGL